MNHYKRFMKLVLLGLTFILATIVSAQNRTCHAIDDHNHKMEHNPKYKLAHQNKITKLEAEANKEKALCANPVIYPVAVHYQVAGLTESDRACLVELALSQIEILNNDYQGTNADISNWTGNAANSFPGIDYGETCIQFCLATKNHPTGYGISDGDYAVTILQNSGDNDNNWSGYINFFIQAGTGVLGYSPLGGSGNGDGVVIDANAFGSGSGCNGVVPGAPYNLGRTLTHELGHYFLLDHIWGGGCASDDDVADTPDSQSPYYGCPSVGEATCSSTDMHMNYMDYTNDACMYMFSAGQSTRMENYGNGNLTNVINNAANVCGPIIPTVSFVSAASSLAEGSSNCSTAGTKTITVELQISSEGSADAELNFSFAGTATENEDYEISSSSVTFPTGTTANQSFDITIYEDGKIESDETIEISYTLNNNGGDVVKGTTNETFTLTITNDDNDPSTASSGTTNLLEEDWEGTVTWTADNSGQNAWTVGTSPNLTNRSAYISRNGNAHSYSNQTSASYLISPVIDATGFSNLNLSFDYLCEGEIFQGTLYDYGTLHYSTDGSNWIAFGSEYQGVSTASSGSATLPAAAENISTLQIAFKWENDNGVRNNPPFAVDNIVLSGDFSDGVSIQDGINSATGFSERELGPFETIYYYDNLTGNIMLSIENTSSHDYGCTRVEVDRSGNSSMSSTAPESDQTTAKSFIVTPQFNNAAGSYVITLYYTSDEIDGWVNGSGFAIGDLQMLKSASAIQSASSVEIVSPTAGTFGSDYTYTANFSTGFSGFALGNESVVLPVEYLAFEASPNKESIQLNWSTASEKDNDGFSLERMSELNGNFEKIAWIDGHANSQITQTYSFLDNNVRPNTIYYYRLAQTDFDGQIKYSNIVNAKIQGTQTTLAISPNPIKDEMRIQLEGPQILEGQLIITDVLGRTLKSIAYDGEQYLEMSLDLSDLDNGVYLIQLYNKEEFVEVRKFVKAK